MRTSPASALKHCDSSDPPQSPSTCFPTHPSPCSCGHPGWKTHTSVTDVTEQILPRKMLLHGVPSPTKKPSTLVSPIGQSPRTPHYRESSHHSRLPRLNSKVGSVVRHACCVPKHASLLWRGTLASSNFPSRWSCCES